jgi:predicted transcriptional regulator
MNRIWSVGINEFNEIAKALSSDLRVEIFKEIQKKSLTVNEIAAIFNLPSSTATVNVKKLEEAKLIKTELVPGTRGSQKVCSALYDRLVIDLEPLCANTDTNYKYIEMPIGHFVNCQIKPSCGLVTESDIIGYVDDPRSFFEPEKMKAQLIWFKHGFIEYRFPNKVPYNCRLTGIELSMEICSEAPNYALDWPSDITLWINGIEVGTWMSPGDFGGERGVLTPGWWDSHMTQFGLLKKWRVNETGSFIDGSYLSDVTVPDLGIDNEPSLTVRLGIKEDAKNQGGLNLFGQRFGNYDQDLIMRLEFEQK